MTKVRNWGFGLESQCKTLPLDFRSSLSGKILSLDDDERT
jgi:hypothetical protein